MTTFHSIQIRNHEELKFAAHIFQHTNNFLLHFTSHNILVYVVKTYEIFFSCSSSDLNQDSTIGNAKGGETNKTHFALCIISSNCKKIILFKMN